MIGLLLLVVCVSISAVSADFNFSFSSSESSNSDGDSIKFDNGKLVIQGIEFAIPDGYKEVDNAKVLGNDSKIYNGFKESSDTFAKGNDKIIVKVSYSDTTSGEYTPSNNTVEKTLNNQTGWFAQDNTGAFFIFIKDKKIVDMAGNEFKLIESSNPNYNISNQTIDLKVIPQFSENNSYAIDNIRTYISLIPTDYYDDMDAPGVSYHGYKIVYTIKFNIVLKNDPSQVVLEDQFADYSFYFNIEDWWKIEHFNLDYLKETDANLAWSPDVVNPSKYPEPPIDKSISYNNKKTNSDRLILSKKKTGRLILPVKILH